MEFRYVYLATAGAVVAALSSLLFPILLRHRTARPATVKRATSSRVGIGLQFLGFGAVFALPRQPLTPFLPSPLALPVAALSIGLALGGAAFMAWAILTLGRQWSLQARLLENHQLVMVGPYRLVRHPIYTGFLALFLATALAFTTPLVLVAGLSLMVAGTALRVRAEDALLRSEFGERFEAWRARVKAVVPDLI